jgi:hypothetical protein
MIARNAQKQKRDKKTAGRGGAASKSFFFAARGKCTSCLSFICLQNHTTSPLDLDLGLDLDLDLRSDDAPQDDQERAGARTLRSKGGSCQMASGFGPAYAHQYQYINRLRPSKRPLRRPGTSGETQLARQGRCGLAYLCTSCCSSASRSALQQTSDARAHSSRAVES